MKQVITVEKKAKENQVEARQITTDNMCLMVSRSKNENPSKALYIVYDVFSTENYRINPEFVEMLIESGCPEDEAISMLIMARKTLSGKAKITNKQIANILCELLDVHGYPHEKILRIISGLGEADAYALYNHKRLPAGFDRYFMADGWETDGSLEEAFLEKEEEDEIYN